MSNKAKMELIVLFEDEIRVAAKAVKHFYKVVEDGATAQEQEQAFQNLCNSCAVALAGAESDDACILLGKKPFGDKEGVPQ